MGEELLGGGGGPAAIGCGAGGGGVQDLAVFDVDSVEGVLGLLLGEASDADDPFGLEDFDAASEVQVAGFEEGGAFGCGKFVGGTVSRAFFHEDERAIVEDEVFGEEVFGVWIALGKESPEASARDFGLFAIEAEDGPLGVFGLGLLDRFADAHPVFDGVDFAEGNSGLGHAPGARIHAHEDDALFGGGVAFEVGMVRFPSVAQRIVDVGDRGRKGERVDRVAEFFCGLGEFGSEGHRAIGSRGRNGVKLVRRVGWGLEMCNAGGSIG